jgi:hypothetical protein
MASPRTWRRATAALLLLVPALIEFLEVQGAGPTIVPKGRFSGWFDIGGRRQFLRFTGHGSPTVVFEGGLTTDWYDLQNQLSGFTRVCSYDRPGGPASRSDPAPTPRTARGFVADLHALLRAAPRAWPLCPGRPLQQRPVHPAICQHPPPAVAGLILIDAVHPAYHQRQLALLKPLLPPEVWEALRREAMTPPHRLVDPQGVDIWTEAAVTASQPTPPDPKVSPHRDPLESGSRQVLPSLADPVRQALDERSGGRLQLDPPTPRRSGQPM